MNTSPDLNGASTPITPSSTDQVAQQLVKPLRFPTTPHEWKIVSLRECPNPDDMYLCDTHDRAAEYWRRHVVNHPYYDPGGHYPTPH